jgi:hypothetical protein
MNAAAYLKRSHFNKIPQDYQRDSLNTSGLTKKPYKAPKFAGLKQDYLDFPMKSSSNKHFTLRDFAFE